MGVREDVETWEPATIIMVFVVALVACASVCIWIGVALWSSLGGGVHPGTLNPFELARLMFEGSMPGAATWAVGSGIGILVIVLAMVVVIKRRKGRGRRGDRSAYLAGRGKAIEAMSQAAARDKARRFGITDAVGLPIGQAVAGGTPLVSSFEDVCTVIAGPRTGKTKCWVVPRIFAAPGAVVATSNKRDIADDTRAYRAEVTGEAVWVFDPQSIANETQTFWWNPLSYVTDAVQASALAEIFYSAGSANGGREMHEWDSWSCNLIAALLLAAERGGRPLTELHRWLNNQMDDEPVVLLQSAGEEMMATSLRGLMDLVPETRSGVYGGASRIMHFLNNSKAMAWATPQSGMDQFDPSAFVRSRQTLYCLSQEGRGSASAIVTALTVAVTEAAVEYAKGFPGGRLQVPMLVELDEAANVCRWRELPDQYSHFGSRGICVDTVLQSWSQGETVWGKAGINKLWSASNVALYGGGAKEDDAGFLRKLSDMIGVHYVDSQQVSTSTSGRSYSTSKESNQRPIATVSDLAALPRGRGWVFGSGSVPAMIRLVPHWEQKIRARDQRAEA